MKRKIFLAIILLLEAFVLFVFGYYKDLGSPELLKPIFDFGQAFFDNVITSVNEWLHLTKVNHGCMITTLIINVVFILVYALIFGLIKLLIVKMKTKKIRKVVTIPYALNEREVERFSYERYMKKFPWIRTLSLIVPIFFLAIFILARYDVNIGNEIKANVIGTSTFYSKYIQTHFASYTLHNALITCFTNPQGIGYIDLVNKMADNLSWVEYIILSVGSLIILLIWYGLMSLLYLPFRKVYARRRARTSLRKYIYKKESKEYKHRKKHQDEYSSKSEQFMNLVEEENSQKQAIASSQGSPKLEAPGTKPGEYFDDLGSNVKDLGVGTSSELPLDKPFIEREVRYISDSDFDIVLENEPVIEVAEEEGIDSLNEQMKEDELFYEKYQPDDVEVKPFEEYDKSRTIVSDYVNEINEEPQELVEPEKAPEEPKEEPKAQEPQVVEKKEEPQEEKELTPLEKYRQEKKKCTEEHKRLLAAGLLTEDNDPLKKYRKVGARSGKSEEKVPTFEEIEAEKQRLHDERSKKIKAGIAKAKKENESGEKKIPPMKKTKKVVPGERKVPPQDL